MKNGTLVPILLIVLLGFSGCARFAAEKPAVPDPESKLTAAERLVKETKFSEAIEAYRNIQLEYPNSEWSAQAKYRIGMTLVSPENPQRDYAQALKEFDEFSTHYPAHEKAGNARSWRLALKTLLDAKRDNERLKKNIEQLKQLDMRQEEKRKRRK